MKNNFFQIFWLKGMQDAGFLGRKKSLLLLVLRFDMCQYCLSSIEYFNTVLKNKYKDYKTKIHLWKLNWIQFFFCARYTSLAGNHLDQKKNKSNWYLFFHRYPGVIFILAQSFHSPVHLDFGVLKCQVSPHNSWQINRMCLI